ncbi:MAG: nucleoside triphosphate pyrophosphohydrolase [Salibacteraceae bacterium]
MKPELDAFERLLLIISELRENCPWDRKQTVESLRHLTIEETYELSDAIIEKDYDAIKQELGDLIMHVVFYARIASESRQFDIIDVLDEVCEKLIRRHPHIYGDVQVADDEEVKKNWEKIKLNEGKTSVLSGVPKGLPAMVKAIRIQDKARGVGFDWNHRDEVWAKVNEELAELKHEIDRNANPDRIEDEFGDVLFSLINYARFVGVNPEDALERTNRKFISRFTQMEEKAEALGKSLSSLTIDELEELWQSCK